MPQIGPMEIAIVLVIALLVFGPKKLPELGRGLGQGMRDFKRGLSGDDDDERERERESREARVDTPTITTAAATPPPVVETPAEAPVAQPAGNQPNPA